MITYKLAQDAKESLHFAKIALDNQLFVPGWTMRDYLQVTSIVFLGACVALAFDGDKPIAVALSAPYSDSNHVMFFVHESYRRQGVATNLLNLMNLDNGKKLFGVEGIRGSKKFFEKHNIMCY